MPNAAYVMLLARIFASRELKTRSCEYLGGLARSDTRNGRLSDHAPVEAESSQAGGGVLNGTGGAPHFARVLRYADVALRFVEARS